MMVLDEKMIIMDTQLGVAALAFWGKGLNSHAGALAIKRFSPLKVIVVVVGIVFLVVFVVVFFIVLFVDVAFDADTILIAFCGKSLIGFSLFSY